MANEPCFVLLSTITTCLDCAPITSSTSVRSLHNAVDAFHYRFVALNGLFGIVCPLYEPVLVECVSLFSHWYILSVNLPLLHSPLSLYGDFTAIHLMAFCLQNSLSKLIFSFTCICFLHSAFVSFYVRFIVYICFQIFNCVPRTKSKFIYLIQHSPVFVPSVVSPNRLNSK